MHMFIEQGMRGGISTVGGKRFARANNPKLSDYDPSQAFSYIMYLDANNLYGWAMSRHLPVGGFKWVRTEFLDLKKFENQIRSWRPYQKKGYILEVDLEYPQRLHDLHNDYPLAPEKSKVPRAKYSRYQQELADHLNIEEDDTEKLLLTLNDKKNYVVHYRTLQLYLRLGMKLTKVHRAVSFIQTDWMKEYIDFNTQERAKATTKFEKDLYKLMNNSVFGKTMENLRSRVNMRLVNGDDLKTLRKLALDPLLADWRAFGGNLYGLHMRRDHILFNRPIYMGMCVLELSKLLMYKFYYDHLKVKYGEKCKLIYTDIDSLLLDVECEDFYKEMEKDLHLYDTSDYPKDHPCYSGMNKKVIGKFKDECNGKPIEEVICLRSKMYSIMKGDKKCEKKAKGTAKPVVKYNITHASYQRALFVHESMRHEMDWLQSKDHQIYGVRTNKVSISPFDSKRYTLYVGLRPLAHKSAKRVKGLAATRVPP